jgi:hypothetical protein
VHLFVKFVFSMGKWALILELASPIKLPVLAHLGLVLHLVGFYKGLAFMLIVENFFGFFKGCFCEGLTSFLSLGQESTTIFLFHISRLFTLIVKASWVSASALLLRILCWRFVQSGFLVLIHELFNSLRLRHFHLLLFLTIPGFFLLSGFSLPKCLRIHIHLLPTYLLVLVVDCPSL